VHEIDLIPNDYRAMILRKHCFKLFVTVLSGLFLVSASTYGAIGYVTKNMKSDISRLQHQKDITSQQHDELVSLRALKEEHTQQLKLLEGLRSGIAAERMFVTIDRVLTNDNVWFSTWEFKRAGTVIKQQPKSVNTGYFIVIPQGSARAEPQTWKIQTKMNIKGQSRDHSALSTFIRQLFEQPEIQDVRIIRTAVRRYSSHSVVDFDLEVIVSDGKSKDKDKV